MASSAALSEPTTAMGVLCPPLAREGYSYAKGGHSTPIAVVGSLKAADEAIDDELARCAHGAALFAVLRAAVRRAGGDVVPVGKPGKRAERSPDAAPLRALPGR